MPYGAPELIAGARSRMAVALVTSSSSMVLAMLLACVGLSLLVTRTVEVPSFTWNDEHHLERPPQMNNVLPPLQPSGPAIPTIDESGPIVPVPDALAPLDEPFVAPGGMDEALPPAMGDHGDGITMAPPEAEFPARDSFIYAEELPELIRCQPVVYPEIARQAGVEGTVLVHILVGRDGRAMKVEVDSKLSIPMLDDAAVASARTCVFKPALANRQPVVVWVRRPYKFKLHE
jgi:TonB family protein